MTAKGEEGSFTFTIRPGDIVAGTAPAELIDTLTRARVVGILDAWRQSGDSITVGTYLDGSCFCSLLRGTRSGRTFGGSTADEARGKAASAIEKGEF